MSGPSVRAPSRGRYFAVLGHACLVFSLTEMSRDLTELPTCKRCVLSQTRQRVVVGSGPLSPALMVIGEAPGRDEDEGGEPFIGRSGRLLFQLIQEEVGLARAECFVTNVVKCRPPGNRDPAPAEVAACSHYLEAQVAAVAPAVIVTLGNFAVRALLGTTDTVTRLRGTSYPYLSTVVVPTFHPSYALRGGGVVVAEIRADLVRAKRLLAKPGP